MLDTMNDPTSGDVQFPWSPLSRRPGLLPPITLCEICAGLDLTVKDFLVYKEDVEAEDSPSKVLELGPTSDIRKKPNCPLCALLIEALNKGRIPDTYEGVTVHIQLDIDKSQAPKPFEDDSGPQVKPILPIPYTGDDVLGVIDGTLRMIPEITLWAGDLKGLEIKDKSSTALSIYDTINYEMIQKWLSTCEMQHGENCNDARVGGERLKHPTTTLPKFRIIDTENECLVRGVEAPYVALSYVWGKFEGLSALHENIERLEIPGAFKQPEFLDRIPWTIRDAMQVVRELQLRYLWVDCLCIIQDDQTGEKLELIQHMDQVYGAAYMTIMASSGLDSNSGLPGVRSCTRDTPRIKEIAQDLHLGLRLRSIDLVDDTAYYTRAWCFQERTLSSRMLEFIDGRIVYHCNALGPYEEWGEGSPLKHCPVLSHGKQDSTKSWSFLVQNPDDIREYERFLTDYSNLKLTVATDVYNGLAGVAKIMAVELNTQLCHGLPELCFDWFLGWVPTTRHERREVGPSWSWSGWMGQTWTQVGNAHDQSKGPSAMAQSDEFLNNVWVVWYHRLSNDSTECLPLHPDELANRQKIAQSRFPFDCSRTLPTSTKLTGAPAYAPDVPSPRTGSGFLQFWTVSVFFQIDSLQRPVDDAQRVQFHSFVGIFGRSGKQIGATYVNEDWNAWHVPGLYEFIILCEDGELVDDAYEADGRLQEPGRSYMLMLVQPKGGWYERVGLGSIQVENVSEALGNGPAWKEFILG